MSGTSKHYKMRSGDGTFWDYGIPQNLMIAMTNCAPPFGESIAAGRHREAMRLQAAIAGITSWRKKIQILWGMRNPRCKDYIILVEYRVRPGKKPATCPFRAWITAFRKFKPKKSGLKFAPIPPVAPVNTMNAVFRMPEGLRARMREANEAAAPPQPMNLEIWPPVERVVPPPADDAGIIPIDMAEAEARIADRMNFVLAQNAFGGWRAPAVRNRAVLAGAPAGPRRHRDGRR